MLRGSSERRRKLKTGLTRDIIRVNHLVVAIKEKIIKFRKRQQVCLTRVKRAPVVRGTSVDHGLVDVFDGVGLCGGFAF
jgi:hypothetical protein